MNSICKSPTRYFAAQIVAENWRIRKRLPRLTAYAKLIGLILSEHKPSKSTPAGIWDCSSSEIRLDWLTAAFPDAQELYKLAKLRWFQGTSDNQKKFRQAVDFAQK